MSRDVYLSETVKFSWENGLRTSWVKRVDLSRLYLPLKTSNQSKVIRVLWEGALGGWKWFPVIPRHYGVIGVESV